MKILYAILRALAVMAVPLLASVMATILIYGWESMYCLLPGSWPNEVTNTLSKIVYANMTALAIYCANNSATR